MSESTFWNHIKANIGWLGHFSRVESHETSSGIPDVDYCITGVEGHIELKYGKEKTPKIRGTQVRWFSRRVQQGGRPWMLTHLFLAGDDYYMLHAGKDVNKKLAEERNYLEWAKTATKVWTENINWNELMEYLTHEHD